MGEVELRVKPHQLVGGCWSPLRDPNWRLKKGHKVQGDLLVAARWDYDWEADNKWLPFEKKEQKHFRRADMLGRGKRPRLGRVAISLMNRGDAAAGTRRFSPTNRGATRRGTARASGTSRTRSIRATSCGSASTALGASR